jgi:hypothetical protein
MSAIGKFLRRSHREKLLVALAATALIEARIELRLIGFRHRGWLEQSISPRGKDHRSKPRHELFSADQIAWAVAAASARIPGATNCLVRAVALKYLLNILGHDARLRIGAGRLEGRFEGHAWIESDGRILIGEFDDGRYTPFPLRPAAPPSNRA